MFETASNEVSWVLHRLLIRVRLHTNNAGADKAAHCSHNAPTRHRIADSTVLQQSTVLSTRSGSKRVEWRNGRRPIRPVIWLIARAPLDSLYCLTGALVLLVRRGIIGFGLCATQRNETNRTEPKREETKWIEEWSGRSIGCLVPATGAAHEGEGTCESWVEFQPMQCRLRLWVLCSASAIYV